MEDTITIKEINDWMDAGLIFSFTGLTHDEKKAKKSGKWVTVGEAIALKHEDSLENYEEMPHVQSTMSDVEQIPIAKKNPNHKLHWTRNIRLCAGKKPIGFPFKIHIDLLTRFNGRKVILP